MNSNLLMYTYTETSCSKIVAFTWTEGGKEQQIKPTKTMTKHWEGRQDLLASHSNFTREILYIYIYNFIFMSFL